MAFPSKEQIEVQILRALAASRGRAKWERVAERVAQHFKLDKETLSRQTARTAIRGGHTDWQQRVRNIGLRMDGITRRGGKWALTESGRQRVRKVGRPARRVRVLLIHGPNLNMLGRRDTSIYGTTTLRKMNASVEGRGRELGVEVVCFQSNSEGVLIDFIQEHSAGAKGIVINPGALTHYGLSLRDALEDAGLPVVEVHLSNIYAREEWRAESVIAPIARGQISGLGWWGYIAALELLVRELKV
ncbi:MAG: type II 3-dehydroquinate dehydratase [Dehalococcoidia bacterium]